MWQTSLHNPNFAEYAELRGASGRRVTEKLDLDDAIAAGLAHSGPALIEVVSDPNLVWPGTVVVRPAARYPRRRAGASSAPP